MSTLQQDTRQLTAHIDGDHEGRIEQDGWGITIRVDHAEDPEMIRELVRRWNAHNAMRDALEAICDLPADDQGQRTIPAGYLDQARTAIEQATK